MPVSSQLDSTHQVSYLEIYNEVINDLLAPESVNLKIREEKGRGVYVDGLKEEVVVSPEQVMSLIAGGEGTSTWGPYMFRTLKYSHTIPFAQFCRADTHFACSAYRHVGATDYNEVSSRSHTLFRMVRAHARSLPHRPERVFAWTDHREQGTLPREGCELRWLVSRSCVCVGACLSSLYVRTMRALREYCAAHARQLHKPISTQSLIDLAGSERASESLARRKEGGYINKSLLTLGNVIAKLSEMSVTKDVGHIPYRDSKLTRILEPSLSGNARIAIICTVTIASGAAAHPHWSICAC